jgi:mannose-1-phosphate guanylyltransferase
MFKLLKHVEKGSGKVAPMPARGTTQHIALVLAGGDGTRLQELTREITGEPIPKQYCRLLKNQSLLEATLSRACHFAPNHRTTVIVNQNHLEVANDQLRMLPVSNIFVQPSNRDTGPGMIYSLLHIARMYPDAVIASFPSDHYVDNDHMLISHVRRAATVVSRTPDKIVLLGIAPDRPETEYGYILPGRPVRLSGHNLGLSCVAGFKEKPRLLDAEKLIAEGSLWNMFLMVFQLSRMLELLKKFAPKESGILFNLPLCQEKAVKAYKDLAPWNFSSQFLAHITEHLLVLKVSNVAWSDWGTRESIERTFRSLQIVPAWRQSGGLSSLQAS